MRSDTEICGDEVKKRVLTDGWASISNTADIDLDRLAGEIGRPIKSHTTGARSKLLRPYTKDAAPLNSMSALTGMGEQPMHTDCAYFPLPPRYMMLRCVSPGEEDCPTLVWVVDWDELYTRHHAILKKPGWIIRGGGFRRPFYGSVLNCTWLSDAFLRFDPCCMSEPEGETVERVSNAIRESSYLKRMNWSPGAALIIDNWRCLHARAEGAKYAPGRLLERWLMGDEDGLVGRSSY